MRVQILLFLAALGLVASVPAPPPHAPAALFVLGMAPGSVAPGHQSPSSPALLPPSSSHDVPDHDHMLRNQSLPSSPKTHMGMSTGSGMGPFDGRCKRLRLGGQGKTGKTTLDGQCLDDRGTWWETSLNLNDCLGNQAGRLAAKPLGNFDSTCRPCSLAAARNADGVLLNCSCLDSIRKLRFSVVEMGSYVRGADVVRVVNGRFTCASRNGTKSPAEEEGY